MTRRRAFTFIVQVWTLIGSWIYWNECRSRCACRKRMPNGHECWRMGGHFGDCK